MIQKKKLDEAKERELKDIENDVAWEPVRIQGKMNLKNKETGEYLSPEWFNWCGYMDEGISVVRNDEGKYNYLKNDGTLLLDEWYDDVEEFRGGKGRIVHDEVYDGEYQVFFNYVDRNGNILGEWELAV